MSSVSLDSWRECRLPVVAGLGDGSNAVLRREYLAVIVILELHLVRSAFFLVLEAERDSPELCLN